MIYVLITPEVRGLLDLEQVTDGMFSCGHCSKQDIAVYHNVSGRHIHIANQPEEYEKILSLGD